MDVIGDSMMNLNPKSCWSVR